MQLHGQLENLAFFLTECLVGRAKKRVGRRKRVELDDKHMDEDEPAAGVHRCMADSQRVHHREG